MIPLQNLISSQPLLLLQKLSLAYLSQFFINFQNQWQFQNPHASRLQNCPWSLNFMKKWLRYARLKARLHFCRRNKSCDEIKFWSGINCLNHQISQPKLHQIEHVGDVLKSSWQADFKTVIGFQIWWGFHIEKGQKPLSQSKDCALYYEQ